MSIERFRRACVAVLSASLISLGMQAPNFSRMLHMVENRRLDPGKLVHRKIKLEEASDVLEAMDKFGTVGVTVINQY